MATENLLDQHYHQHQPYHHHRHSHNDQPCQQCKECQLFITKKESFDHMEIEHKKQDECPFCSFKVGSIEFSQVSNADIKGQCNKNLSSRKKLMNHIRVSHRTKFKCGYCYKLFLSEDLLREHKDILLKQSERTVEACHRKANYPKYWKRNPAAVCSLCGISVTCLKSHMANFHNVGQKEYFKYGCSFCAAVFGEPRKLKRHLAQVHFPQNRYKCQNCEKSFSTEERLKVHLRFHDVPSLKCPQCDKYFKWGSNVIQHLQGSHYPPSYECLPCSQKFHYRATARMHLIKQHNIEDVGGNIVKHKIDMDADIEKLHLQEKHQREQKQKQQ